MTGIIIGALSGTSFQISDPTGAMSAILIGIVTKDGLQNKSLRHCTLARTSCANVHFGSDYGSSSSFIIGIVLSAVLFIMRSEKLEYELAKVENRRFRGDENIEDAHSNSYVLYLTGPIFFINAVTLEKALEKLPQGCGELIFSMRGVSAIDTTGAEILTELVARLKLQNIRVILCGLNDNTRHMLDRAGVISEIGDGAVFNSVDRALTAAN